MMRSLETVIREDYDDDPVAYAEERHPNDAKWELQKANYQLWYILRERGLLIHIKTVKADFGDDSLKCCEENYPDYTTGQLLIANRSLYNRMRRDGNINKLRKSDRIKSLLENYGLKKNKKNVSLYFRRLRCGEVTLIKG